MILQAHPNRGVVISNSSVDYEGRQLPPHARLLTVLLPAGGPNIYNATLQLIKELEGREAVCDEIIFTVTTNLPDGNQVHFHQCGNVFHIDYPLPKLKLAGQFFTEIIQESDFSSCLLLLLLLLLFTSQRLNKRKRRILRSIKKYILQTQDKLQI